MSGATIIHDLSEGWEVRIADFRQEGDAVVGEVEIHHQGERLGDNLPVTLNHEGSLAGYIIGLREDYPDRPDLHDRAGEIMVALGMLGTHPELAQGVPLGQRRQYAMTGRRVLEVSKPHQQGRYPAAWIEIRDDRGSRIYPRIEAVFDEGPGARYVRTALDIDSRFLATIERDVLADLATPAVPTSRIVRSGDIALTEPDWLIVGILPSTGLTLLDNIRNWHEVR